jgi:uncharacterized membrane protein
MFVFVMGNEARRYFDTYANRRARRMRWTGYVTRMGEKRNAYRILVGKQEGKTPLGRPRYVGG